MIILEIASIAADQLLAPVILGEIVLSMVMLLSVDLPGHKHVHQQRGQNVGVQLQLQQVNHVLVLGVLLLIRLVILQACALLVRRRRQPVPLMVLVRLVLMAVVGAYVLVPGTKAVRGEHAPVQAMSLGTAVCVLVRRRRQLVKLMVLVR